MTGVLERVGGIQRRVPFGIALTFDAVTDDALAALHARDVRATFFLDDADAALVELLRARGHGIGWRTEDAHDELIRITGRVVKLHRPIDVPASLGDAIALRRRRFDTWLWSVDEADVDGVRERDVVLVRDDVERVLDVVCALDVALVAL